MRRTPDPALHALSWALIVCSLVLYMTLSASTLANLGVKYDIPGGSMPVKIHPGTYALCAGLMVGLVAWGNPLRPALALVQQAPLPSMYLACMVSVALWAIWRHGSSGMAFFIDALWMPGVALLALELHPRRRHRQLLWWLATLLCMNAVVAIVEAILGHTLLPQYRPEGIVPESMFRASALLDHPLTNAIITASLWPILWVLPMGKVLCVALQALLLMSLLAFGGRSSLVLAVAIYGLAAIVVVLRRTVTGRFSYLQLTGGLVAVVLGMTALVAVIVTTGLGERIFSNLFWDNSANVRLVAWDALGHLDSIDWWVGVSAARIEAISHTIGLDTRYEAIENFWIAILLQVGLIGMVPFLVGLLAGVIHILRIAPFSMGLGVLVFFVAGTGANTLASKTVALTLLFIAGQCSGAYLPKRGVDLH